MLDDLRAFVFAVAGWGWIGLVASERGLRLLTLPVAAEGLALDLVPDRGVGHLGAIGIGLSVHVPVPFVALTHLGQVGGDEKAQTGSGTRKASPC